MNERLQTPQDVHALVDGLVFSDETVAQEDLPPVAAPDDDALVPRSFKLPLRLDRGLEELAKARGLTKSDLVREYLEIQYATEMATRHSEDEPISRADALRALAALRPLPRSA
jgi:predicted DNA-binding protein